MAKNAVFPKHGWIGIALTILFWGLNWGLDGLRTHWGFFPLWLGYILVVDALVYARKGDSLLARSRKSFLQLFILSAPAWWLFELLNERTQNWDYIGREFFSDLQYAVLASLSFSTVMPAVFVSAELAGTFGWVKGRTSGLRLSIPPKWMSITGASMLICLLLWPGWFFPFVWLSLVFLLEPLNDRLGNPTLSGYISTGNWQLPVALGLGGLLCGFFWEFWNFFSYPKWVYNIPIFGFGHVFEMPILGYGGYLPFAWELWALYQLAAGIFPKSFKTGEVIRFEERSSTI